MGHCVAPSLQSSAVTHPPFSPSHPAPVAGAPAAIAHPRAIRSFVRRAGRTTAGQTRAVQDLGPLFLVPYEASINPLGVLYPQLATGDPLKSFAGPPQERLYPLAGQTAVTRSEQALSPTLCRTSDVSPGGPGEARDGGNYPDNPAPEGSFAPLVLEIGFGMGEATAHIAAQLPGTQFLCCEVHAPGVGALLKRIGELGLSNVRILAHDAVEVVDNMLPPWRAAHPACGLDGVHVFFPDPWHKKRHNKRRLLQSPLVARLASRLKPGAYLHCATDWQPYAEQMLQVLGDEPLLENRAAAAHPELGGFAPKPHYRPLTKFEQRGIGLGHGVWDLVFHRV